MFGIFVAYISVFAFLYLSTAYLIFVLALLINNIYSVLSCIILIFYLYQQVVCDFTFIKYEKIAETGMSDQMDA